MLMETPVMSRQAAVDLRLVTIAARHCKLALEGIGRHTTPERKADVKLEIAALRIERDWLLSLLT